MSIAESKAALRVTLRAARDERDANARAKGAEGIAQHVRTLIAPGASVSAYLSMATEPGTHALVADLLGSGHRVVLPRIAGRRLEWVPMSAHTVLRRGPMGIREPEGSALPISALSELDVMLVPGLAVDGKGRRLGQGGGYYDQTLAAVPSRAAGGPLRAILLFDDEILDSIPFEPHDCIVDLAVTPTSIIRFPEAP